MHHELIVNLLALMLGATALVALCHRLGLSSIVGYLAAGLVFGPHLLGVLHESEAIHWLAEVGVVLLMFTIGLEFSLPRLLASRRLVLGLGGAQVATITLLAAAALAALLDLPWPLAVVLGGAVAMSSTAIVLKQLGEQGELSAGHGGIATGILLFQDLAAVPVLVLLPLRGSEAGELGDILWPTIARALAVFLVLVLTGRCLLPRLLHWVAETHSLELFMLAVLAMALSAASVSLLAGLSATLGAFMAGMMLGETHFRHQIEADIRPFRDLMLGIFFLSIGMQLDPSALIEKPLWVLLIVVSLTLVKGMVMFLLVRAFGYARNTALRAAVALAQGGEFGLLLVSQVIALDLGDNDVLQPLLAGTIISMLLAPLLVRHNAALARRLGGSPVEAASELDNVSQDTGERRGHVIIFGYGRFGRGIARVLNENNLETLAIDHDPRRVRELREEGETVLYGDASNAALLELAHVREARAAAITFDDFEHSRHIIAQIRRFNPGLPVLLRLPEEGAATDIEDDNVVVFDSALESSLMFARQLLVISGVDSVAADQAANSVRSRNYSELRDGLEEEW